MKKPAAPPAHEILTPEEQRRRLEDMLLKRCAELKLARVERKRRGLAAKRKAKARHARFLKRCHDCGAMKFYLKNGKKKP